LKAAPDFFSGIGSTSIWRFN